MAPDRKSTKAKKDSSYNPEQNKFDGALLKGSSSDTTFINTIGNNNKFSSVEKHQFYNEFRSLPDYQKSFVFDFMRRINEEGAADRNRFFDSDMIESYVK